MVDTAVIRPTSGASQMSDSDVGPGAGGIAARMSAMDEADFRREMDDARHPVSVWANGPHYCYAPHSHPYKKFVFCVEGSIVFHTAGGDVALAAGERMALDPGVEHSATIGPGGVRCAEAHA